MKWAAVAVGALALVGCKQKVTTSQCDAIVERYAELVVKESMPDASAETIAKERAREKNEAHGDDAFKNCTSEVQPADYDCAMKATSADALEKCLE